MIFIDRYLTVFICINTGISAIIYIVHHNTIIIYPICNLYNLICIYIYIILPTACLYKSYMYFKYTYIYIGNNVPVHLIPYTYFRTYLSDIDLMHYSLHYHTPSMRSMACQATRTSAAEETTYVYIYIILYIYK